eukprot:CAMPEP_0196595076 /NCGR_PEP_ID=MMETSP1081-20130531/80102_1 /TAXON_ID=36882 /ORGANISM="Pyramimonas amylifera, Strain CCMP720" /LENGTH=65 /DNA_ID=CAMNT_0041919529 /DNA_START=787 /DNA_END=984 /DNA_ORIENTATION=+
MASFCVRVVRDHSKATPGPGPIQSQECEGGMLGGLGEVAMTGEDAEIGWDYVEGVCEEGDWGLED